VRKLRRESGNALKALKEKKRIPPAAIRAKVEKKILTLSPGWLVGVRGP